MSGLFGMGNYSKAGSGISKGEQKGRLKLFFEILGVRIWKLFTLNLIYVLFCLPIVTVGPATAGITKVLKNYSIDRNAFVWMDFIDAFKKNFKRAFFWGIADIIAYTGLFCGLNMYAFGITDGYIELPPALRYVLFVLTLSVAITFTIMNYYIYLMMVSTDLPMTSVIKNALVLSYMAPKQNMIAFAGNIILPLIPFLLTELLHNITPLMILPFAPATIIGFIVCFCCYPVVQKMVIAPYYESRGEKNPEDNYCEPQDSEEVLFEDMGGKEKPVVPEKKKVKGKVIS